MEELADHGVTLPPNMQGLTDEQVDELKLKDEWAEHCQPSGGHTQNKDDIGRRNGIGKTKFLVFFSTVLINQYTSYLFNYIKSLILLMKIFCVQYTY